MSRSTINQPLLKDHQTVKYTTICFQSIGFATKTDPLLLMATKVHTVYLTDGAIMIGKRHTTWSFLDSVDQPTTFLFDTIFQRCWNEMKLVTIYEFQDYILFLNVVGYLNHRC